MIKFLDLNKQYRSIKNEIDHVIADVIENSSFVAGPYLGQFEKAFAEFQKADFCVGVGNGTDAIEIALESLELPEQSEVIVPANSFIASSEAVTRSNLKVVFCDCDPETYLLDIDDLKNRITDKTSAIVCVHLYGNPCPMDELLEISKQHDLKLIEDSAQAHGAEYKGQRIGAIGDIGTFSFYPGKNLGAYGDGGAIVTNSKELADRCRMIANHGRVDKYIHEFEGRNSRLDGLQAAILNVKLQSLDSWIEKRNNVAKAYLAGLSDIKGLVCPDVKRDNRHAFHLFVVQTDRRDELRKFLGDLGIQTGVHYPISLTELPAYAYLKSDSSPKVASRMSNTLLSLPIGEHLDDEDIVSVVRSVQTFFRS